MKVLVTGGAGFIGSNLTQKLLDLKNEVICVDNLDPYYDLRIKKENIKPFLMLRNYHFYHEDILNFAELKKIFEKEKPDKICHLAARAGVRPSIEIPQIYQKVNIEGTLNLLELAKEFKIKNFVFASSSSVYGERNKVPFCEDDNTDFPLSPYAATKKAGEVLLWTYHHLYNLNCTVLRFFSVYGPSGRPDMAPYLFTDAIYRGRPIKKFGDGESKRDYTFIDDIVAGIVSALDRNLPYEIINLGNNHPISLNEFIQVIERALEKKAIIKKLPSQPGDTRVTCADITKAKKILKYSPKTSITEGIKKFVSWYLEKTIS